MAQLWIEWHRADHLAMALFTSMAGVPGYEANNWKWGKVVRVAGIKAE